MDLFILNCGKKKWKQAKQKQKYYSKSGEFKFFKNLMWFIKNFFIVQDVAPHVKERFTFVDNDFFWLFMIYE